MPSLMIENGLLITMNPAREILAANIYVEDGRIGAITAERKPADQVIDAGDCLVLPGFIQTHVHLCQALFRGMADDMDVVDWLRLRIWPLEQAHDERSVYDSSRLAIAEMIRSGTTCALTNETVHYTEAAFQAILETGFRAVSGKIMMDQHEVGTEMKGETTRASLEQSLTLLRAYHRQGNGRLRYAFCPRGPRNCTRELWQEITALAAEHDALIHSHAAENQAQAKRLADIDGQTDIAYLHSIGASGPRLVLAHCVWTSEAEMNILAETRTKVTHCPSANMKLASGFAPIPEYLRRGIHVSLGSDGAPCNNNMDMFQEMRLAALIHKPRFGPRSMPALTVLEMATINGARALGLEQELGSLEPGKRADIILIRRHGLHVQPEAGVSPVTQLVYEHKSSDVDTVVIDGKILLQGGQFTGLDPAEIRAHANESARRLLARANLPG